MALPRYFYDINAVLPNGYTRWADPFAESSDFLENPKEVKNKHWKKMRYMRNASYEQWIGAFRDENHDPIVKPKQMKWQVIRCLSFKHSESSSLDWWENYQDAVFRVFIQPETVYCDKTQDWKQWYILSPEDCYLVNKYEIEKKGAPLPERDYLGKEMFLSMDKRLRQMRLIPTENSAHLRHETTGGVLPEGL